MSKIPTQLIWLCLLLMSLLGCATTPQTRYPATIDIAQLGGEQRFPISAAGFVRVGSMVYARDGSDYSVGYNRYDPGLVQTVTMYFYPAKAELDKQFAAEVQNVLQTHEQATMLKMHHTTLAASRGQKYQGRIARFEYLGAFGQEVRDLNSVLILVELPDRFFKVRATNGRNHLDTSDTVLYNLIDEVGWDQH